eukprot:5080347-Pleurochrysis_carterae.AAC.1
MVNGRGAGARAGAGRTYRAARGRGRSLGITAAITSGFQELGERSASAPQVCMGRGSKTANGRARGSK